MADRYPKIVVRDEEGNIIFQLEAKKGMDLEASKGNNGELVVRPKKRDGLTKEQLWCY